MSVSNMLWKRMMSNNCGVSHETMVNIQTRATLYWYCPRVLMEQKQHTLIYKKRIVHETSISFDYKASIPNQSSESFLFEVYGQTMCLSVIDCQSFLPAGCNYAKWSITRRIAGKVITGVDNKAPLKTLIHQFLLVQKNIKCFLNIIQFVDVG